MCDYCQEERNLFASAEGDECRIDEIMISDACLMPPTGPIEEQHRIFIEMDYGEAMTVPINYCPMCGRRLAKAGER